MTNTLETIALVSENENEVSVELVDTPKKFPLEYVELNWTYTMFQMKSWVIALICPSSSDDLDDEEFIPNPLTEKNIVFESQLIRQILCTL